jgi:aminopeptidase
MFNKISEEIKLAEKLVNYSCKVKENEKVLVTYSNCPDSFIEALIEEITKAKAIPIIYRLDKNIKRRLLLNSNENIINSFKEIVKPIMENSDAVIMIGGSDNDFELSDIPSNIINLYNKLYVNPIHFNIRCNKKWVLLRYPTPSFAQISRLSTEMFSEFFFKVCTLDYKNLNEKMTPLKELMEKTDKVEIITPNTNLTFSIKNMPSIKCSGECNIPDGEIYSAPIKHSVNGHILFNIPVIEHGVEFNNIKLIFKDGKIIDFDCNNKEKFKEILDTDEGSRYLGEFAFGLNPYCKEPIKDILFDEKMTSSIHLAIGSSYDDCNNGNKSSIHLDLIQSHKKELGGGKIYFDCTLIYENGKFILPNLVALNSENLL